MYQEMGFPPILSDSTLTDYILKQIPLTLENICFHLEEQYSLVMHEV